MVPCRHGDAGAGRVCRWRECRRRLPAGAELRQERGRAKPCRCGVSHPARARVVPSTLDCVAPTATDAPGPRINLSSTDSLTIYLQNTLDTPVSIVIPGLPGGGDPVPMAGDGASRPVAHPRDRPPEPDCTGTPGTYTWNSLRAGSYLYQSGTQQSIQVAMGLYGALIVHSDAADANYAATVLADGATHYYRLGETGWHGSGRCGPAGSDGTYGATVEQGLLLDLSSDTAAGFDDTTGHRALSIPAWRPCRIRRSRWRRGSTPPRLMVRPNIGSCPITASGCCRSLTRAPCVSRSATTRIRPGRSRRR